ncbi:MAG: hypothetical protein LQ350_006466 [Teloschistes chrysophthalmus]|nr:MAG: hypothetical protein LQ350_006466 [Niorma chrysophthalma]
MRRLTHPSLQYGGSSAMKRNQVVLDAPAPGANVTDTHPSPTQNVGGSIVISSPAFKLFHDDDERRSFAFFEARTITDLSGYFPSEFWKRLVPLATYHEPSLKHAVIALASLHERFEKGDRSILKSNKDILEGGFALQQYNKAIQHLIKQPEKPSFDTSLVACVLFACFESLRGHHGSALSHIRSGVQILTQANEIDGDNEAGQSHGTDRLCVPRDTLDVIFARLDAQHVQVSQFFFEVEDRLEVEVLLGSRPMKLRASQNHTSPGFTPEVPAEFRSLEEARNNLDYQWNLCQQIAVDFEYRDLCIAGTETEGHRQAYEKVRVHYQAASNSWSNAFQSFLNNNVPMMDSKTLQAAMVLELSAKTFSMHLDLNAFQLIHDQTSWDRLIPGFEELVDLATAVVDAQRTSPQGLSQKPIFHLDLSLIGPLFTIGHKCRDPLIRRKAISLLYSTPRQEGVWDSILTARVAERIMNLEEEGLGEVKCAADVPDRMRISDVDVSFDLQARRGYVTLHRLRSLDSHVREPVIDVLEW